MLFEGKRRGRNVCFVNFVERLPLSAVWLWRRARKQESRGQEGLESKEKIKRGMEKEKEAASP